MVFLEEFLEENDDLREGESLKIFQKWPGYMWRVGETEKTRW